MKARKLTVSKLFRQGHHRETRFVPFIRVSGKWLARAGFQGGQHITCRAQNGTLVIEACRENAAQYAAKP
jgi:hypothetical protein